MADIIDCPKCQRKLRVPDELLGQMVQCPTCGQTFTAANTTPANPAFSEALPWEQRAANPVTAEPPPQPPPSSFEGFDDWQRVGRRRYAQPHRGTLILVLGILSLVICGFIGPFAWVMGNNDLAEIRAGRMDREGEGLTQAGRICGMIATILMLAGCGIYCVVFAIAGLGGALGR